MRSVTFVLLAGVVAAAVGCRPRVEPDTIFAVKSNQGLNVEFHAPHREFTVGQTMQIKVVAANITSADMTILADSGALVRATLLRQTARGWEEVLRFPGAAVMVVTPWKLRAGGTHAFEMPLPVTREWPTGEWLRMAVELNGRPDVRPSALIHVSPAPAPPAEAAKD